MNVEQGDTTGHLLRQLLPQDLAIGSDSALESEEHWALAVGGGTEEVTKGN